MKKCLSIMILVLVMMLVSIPCFAEITYNEDSFDDTVNFSSKREIGDFRMFNL